MLPSSPFTMAETEDKGVFASAWQGREREDINEIM
jgi:hypothetical protein